MSNIESLPEYYVPREDAEGEISDLVESWWPHIHIHGEPGIGKTHMLQSVENRVGADCDVLIEPIRKHHSKDELFTTVTSIMCDRISEEDLNDNSKWKLNRIGVSIPVGPIGINGGAQRETNEPEVPEIESPKAVLETASDIYNGDRVLICLDDVHNISPEDPGRVESVVQEVRELLPGDVALLTAGRAAFDNTDSAVEITSFSEDETEELLNNRFSSVPEDVLSAVHEQLGGHPLLIELFTEIYRDNEIPPRPRDRLHGDIKSELREKYLNYISTEEEELLRRTAPLEELEPRLCSEVTGESVAATRETISGLSGRAVARKMSGESKYRVHDTFRTLLCDQLSENEKRDVRETARDFYCRRAVEREEIDSEVEQIRSLLQYLQPEDADSESVEQLIEDGIGGSDLSFYSSRLLLGEIGDWDGADLPWSFVETVFEAVGRRECAPNTLFSQNLDSGWGEHLLDRERFEQPSEIELRYLTESTGENPEIVRRAIQQTNTEDPEIRRRLLGIAATLPGHQLVEVTPKLINWLEATDGMLDRYGGDVFERLCEEDKYDVALSVFSVIAEPNDTDEKGGGSYWLMSALENTQSELIDKRSEEFISVLERTTRYIIESQNSGESARPWPPRYKPVSGMSSGTEQYDREHVVYGALLSNASEWISVDPGAPARRELIKKYINDDKPRIRRLGFYLLSEFPEENSDLVERELCDTENYTDSAVQIEHHQVLEHGFTHLDDSAKQQVCQTIRNGPHPDGEARRRAEQMDEERSEGVDELSEKIADFWQRKWLYYIRDELPSEHSQYLEGLVGEYGEPESRPGQLTPTRGGLIHQEPPEDVNDIPRDDAEQFYRFCVDWEPPEDENPFEDSGDNLTEVSGEGLIKVLKNRSEDYPQEFARAAPLLGDAGENYIRTLLSKLEGFTEEGVSFPWEPVLRLCEKVLNDGDPAVYPAGAAVSLLKTAIRSEEAPVPEENPNLVRQLVLGFSKAPEGDVSGADVTDTEPGFRLESFQLLMTYLISENNSWEEIGNDSESVSMVRDRLSGVSHGLEHRWIAKYLERLWVADSELVQETLDDLFPAGETSEANTRLLMAIDGYTRRWGREVPYDLLRPHFVRGMECLGSVRETQTNTDYEKVMACAALGAYVFEGEGPSDDDGLLKMYYDTVEPEAYENVSEVLSEWAGEGDAPVEWEKVANLWEWRLSEAQPATERREGDHSFREFFAFFNYLAKTGSKDVRSVRDLLEDTVPYLARETFGLQKFEPWLAEQSSKHPGVAVELYYRFVSEFPSDRRRRLVHGSQEEHREELYENAVSRGGRAEETAYKIADVFAARGEEFDQEFLSEHL